MAVFVRPSRAASVLMGPAAPLHRTLFQTFRKYIIYLLRRGCYRTALEFAKMLFSLDRSDPAFLLLLIDFLALMRWVGFVGRRGCMLSAAAWKSLLTRVYVSNAQRRTWVFAGVLGSVGQGGPALQHAQSDVFKGVGHSRCSERRRRCRFASASCTCVLPFCAAAAGVAVWMGGGAAVAAVAGSGTVQHP